MKASELIEKLQKLIKQYGDLPIKMVDGAEYHGKRWNITSINYLSSSIIYGPEHFIIEN